MSETHAPDRTTLHGHPYSACTRKVLMTLAEKDALASVDLVMVDLARGEQRSSSHRALHPFARIPALEDAGLVLYESPAIMRYLDRRFGGRRLIPRSMAARARMDQWLSVEPCYAGPPAWKLMAQRLLAPARGQRPDPVVVDEARREMAHVLDVLERALAAQPPHAHLAGRAFTLADITFMPTFQLLQDVRELALVEARPALFEWWARVSARPAWQAVLALGRPEPDTNAAPLRLAA